MNKLFELDENYELQLNKVWIAMVPEFQAILDKDKGSKGDYRGDKKRMAKKKLSHVYLMYDFNSPIRELDEMERRTRAMEYTGLTEKDLNDPDLMDAVDRYREIQFESARSLKTLEAIKKGLSKMDDYFENIDFEKEDKVGRQVNDPTAYMNNIKRAKEAYAALAEFEQMVNEQLMAAPAVRGDVELGELESNRGKFTDMYSQAASAAERRKAKQEEARRLEEEEDEKLKVKEQEQVAEAAETGNIVLVGREKNPMRPTTASLRDLSSLVSLAAEKAGVDRTLTEEQEETQS